MDGIIDKCVIARKSRKRYRIVLGDIERKIEISDASAKYMAFVALSNEITTGDLRELKELKKLLIDVKTSSFQYIDFCALINVC